MTITESMVDDFHNETMNNEPGSAHLRGEPTLGWHHGIMASASSSKRIGDENV